MKRTEPERDPTRKKPEDFFFDSLIEDVDRNWARLWDIKAPVKEAPLADLQKLFEKPPADAIRLKPLPVEPLQPVDIKLLTALNEEAAASDPLTGKPGAPNLPALALAGRIVAGDILNKDTGDKEGLAKVDEVRDALKQAGVNGVNIATLVEAQTGLDEHRRRRAQYMA